VIGAPLLGKWMAATAAGGSFRYTRNEHLTMWQLTLPQVATTLAAALAAYGTFNPAGQRLIDDKLLNVVPVLTQRFLPRMLREEAASTVGAMPKNDKRG
jgi:hypothetical protein